MRLTLPHPFISVITVVRNDPEGFCSTKSSILSQVYQNFEWIVVDGASSDATRRLVHDVISQGDARGISEVDSGIYDAMNKGLHLSRGDYVIFLNAGDRLLDEDSLSRAAAAIGDANLPDVAFFSSEMDFGRWTVKRPVKPPRYIWHGQPGLHQATFIRRSLHVEYPFSNLYRVCGDYHVLARLYKNKVSMESFSTVIGVNSFAVDAASGRQKIRLIREAFLIQRSILGLSCWICLISVIKRSVNSMMFKIFTIIRHYRR